MFGLGYGSRSCLSPDGSRAESPDGRGKAVFPDKGGISIQPGFCEGKKR